MNQEGAAAAVETGVPAGAAEPNVSESAASRQNLGGSRARRVYDQQTGMAKLVAGVEVLLGAIEQVVWDARNLLESSVSQFGDGWQGLRGNAGSMTRKGVGLVTEVQRLGKIAATMSAIVFSYRILNIRGAFMSGKAYRKSIERLHRSNARRFVHLAEDLQGGMVKVGQMLSARSDLFPKAFVEELAMLQDSVEPVEHGQIEQILAEAWGPERLASVTVEVEPLGSASIAQVHLVTLPDGRQAAAKVRRPEIETILRYDVTSMRRVLDAMSAYLPDMDIEPLVDEIAEQLLAEVDFVREKETLKAAAEAVKGFERVRVPEVYDAWCTESILVTEYCPGDRLNTALETRKADRRQAVLETFAELYMRQILIWGFFQPDTHPGNFLVQDDDTLVLLDFGCVRELQPGFRFALANLLRGFIGGDDLAAAEALADLGFVTRSGDLGALVSAARGTLGGLVAGGSEAWDVDAMIQSSLEMMSTIDDDPITEMPKEMVMVGRALSTMGGMFFEHKPDLNPAALMIPVFAEALAQQAAHRAAEQAASEHSRDEAPAATEQESVGIQDGVVDAAELN